MQKSFLAFMQADDNKKTAAEEKRKEDKERKEKARKKREENEGQEGGITKKQKVANGNGGRGGGRGGRDGGEGGRGGGAGGRGAKKGLMELGLGGSEETGDEEEEMPSHDSSRLSEAERSGDGEGGGLAEPVTTRHGRRVVTRNRTDE